MTRSMVAREIKCRIIEIHWPTPTVMSIRFESNRKFDFEPGQFLSLYVPDPDGKSKPLRRAYSFAQGPELSKKEGYELCVKFVSDGRGSNYLKSLKPGDIFRATAPYGDFVFEPPKAGNDICFIATGTGIAPFRSMMASDFFQEHAPQQVTCLFGVREDEEVLFRGFMEELGINAVYCVSQSKSGSPDIFQGRVTDYLKTLTTDWKWHTTDFYVCGNSAMIHEVESILLGGHGVPKEHLHQEIFFMPADRKKLIEEDEAA